MHCALAAALFNAALLAGGQVPASHSTSSLAISTVAIRQGPVIAIDATGPLPLPRVGTLRDPDRLYLDFDGVSTRTLKVRGEDQVVTGVRAGLNSLVPRVTRVVIDLSEPCRYSLETSERGSSHLEIALTPLGSQVTPRRPNLTPRIANVTPRAPNVAPHATNETGRGSGAAPRDAAARRYLAVVQAALARVDVLRDVLHDIDARRNPAVDRLAIAKSQLSILRGTLDNARPTATVEGAHDLLKSVIGFASTALSLSGEASAEVSPNASSAAAGALLMLERAEAELAQPRRLATPEFVGGQDDW